MHAAMLSCSSRRLLMEVHTYIATEAHGGNLSSCVLCGAVHHSGKQGTMASASGSLRIHSSSGAGELTVQRVGLQVRLPDIEEQVGVGPQQLYGGGGLAASTQ